MLFQEIARFVDRRSVDESNEPPWVHQGDLQLQLGDNSYSSIGRKALDRAVAQHGGKMIISHPCEDSLTAAQQDEGMWRALALEQRISTLS